jgi:hypothetical protein
MKSFKNELGWHFYTSTKGLSITHGEPPKSSPRKRNIKVILFLIILVITILVFVYLSDHKLVYDFAPFIASIPFFFLIICFSSTNNFLKYLVISVNRRSYTLFINRVRLDRRDQGMPCYLFKTETEHESDSDLYRVYLRPSEFLEVEEPSEDFNPLVWETTDEQEASLIVDEFCQCGVGETDPEKQHPVIHRNKKTGLLLLAGYILCFIAMLAYLFVFIRPELLNKPDSIKPLLKFIRAFLIFGLFSIIIYAGYQVWFGMMVIKYRQIPPPRMLILFDTKYFQGDIAVKRGRRIVITAAIIIILSLIGGIYVHYNLESLIGLQNIQDIKAIQNK